MKIYSKRHTERQDFWRYREDPAALEKLMAIGISTSIMITDLLSWTAADIDAMLDELRKDIPE